MPTVKPLDFGRHLDAFSTDCTTMLIYIYVDTLSLYVRVYIRVYIYILFIYIYVSHIPPVSQGPTVIIV